MGPTNEHIAHSYVYESIIIIRFALSITSILNHLLSHFFQVECELVDKLDILVHENKADENYKQLFDTM